MTESALKVEVENLSEVKRKLSIDVSSTEVNEEVERAYRELGKRAKVKGFRLGKVPRSVLEMCCNSHHHKDQIKGKQFYFLEPEEKTYFDKDL